MQVGWVDVTVFTDHVTDVDMAGGNLHAVGMFGERTAVVSWWINCGSKTDLSAQCLSACGCERMRRQWHFAVFQHGARRQQLAAPELTWALIAGAMRNHSNEQHAL